MKLGVVGLGSIGQRHIRLVASLGVTDIVALRSGRGATRELPADLSNVRELWDPEAFWRLPLDGVLITSPTSLHGAAVARAAEAKLPTFVEKPLAGDLGELPALSEVAMTRIVVGFCLRFHPLVKALRVFIQGDAFGGPPSPMGRIMKARLYFGSYLPRWHPKVDYRSEYMSRADLGGGVLRTACHELDLAQYLLGPVISVAGEVRRLSDLEIDVDDSAMLTCRTRSGASVLVELDYLNPDPTRTGSFIGSGGRLDYAMSPPTARFVGYDRSTVEVYSDVAYSLEQMYLAQMTDFLRFVQTGTTEGCTYAEGLEVMRIIAATTQLRATLVE